MAQLPAYLMDDTVPSIADRLANRLGGAAPPRISIAGNRFTLIDSGGEPTPIKTLTLDIVIVDANDHTSKMYREDKGKVAYDKDSPTPPDCFSDNGVGPSTLSPKPQNDICMTCPHNARGSAIGRSGALIKACEDRENLAVMLPGENSLYMLTITPGSLKNFRLYANKLRANKTDMWKVVTRLDFESQGVLKLSAVSYIDEEDAPYAKKVAKERLGLWMIGGNDKPITKALPAPAPNKLLQPQLEASVRETEEKFIKPAAPAAPVAEKRKPGRPPAAKKAESQELFGEVATEVEDIPEFLPARGAAKAAPRQSFGIVENAPPPDAEMAETLDKLFADDLDA